MRICTSHSPFTQSFHIHTKPTRLTGLSPLIGEVMFLLFRARIILLWMFLHRVYCCRLRDLLYPKISLRKLYQLEDAVYSTTVWNFIWVKEHLNHEGILSYLLTKVKHKKHIFLNFLIMFLIKMVRTTGLEPVTPALSARCSADWAMPAFFIRNWSGQRDSNPQRLYSHGF